MKMRSPIEQLFVRTFVITVPLVTLPANLIHVVAQEPAAPKAPPPAEPAGSSSSDSAENQPVETGVATFGGGCFWCVEGVFENVPGVLDVVSGYAGGTVAKPSYEMVKTGLTGHAEVCQITYDPAKVTYLQLLEIFLKTHDPTTKNKQGPDYGTQYRSVIFYHNDDQKTEAAELIRRLDQAKAFRGKIVTTLEPLTAFFIAEEYHQDYYRRHPGDAYCMTYTRPKIAKVKKVIKEMERKAKEKASQ